MLDYKEIVIRLGELTLKGKNRKFFQKKLIENMRAITGEYVHAFYDKLFMEYKEETMESLQRVFGIYSYSPALIVETDMELINKKVISLSDKFSNKKFRVSVTRTDKDFPLSSMDYAKSLGGVILDNSENAKVSLKEYDLNLEIEIRKEKTYIYFERIRAQGGLPTGINGKTLHLMSGGIDSPVAALEMMKRGIHVDFLNFVTPPSTDEVTVKKVNMIVEHLSKYQVNTKLYRSDFSKIQDVISLTSDPSYKITLMRRSFYRIATKLAYMNRIDALSNGENIGQVASQTIHSLKTIQKVTDLIIFRPLLTWDKVEIINRAERVNTFKLSIMPANETCEMFAPKNPVIKPHVDVAIRLEEELSPSLFDLELKNVEEEIEIIKI